VIGIKPGEGGSPIVVVAKTTRLRPGEKFTLELSENDPWTGPVILR
jgi:positive regulator of sigma E activity